MTIIATAGHVDHGKTSLVAALTGINTDRLEEEKRRGLTIDLGFAHTDGVSFIDVPGHVRFLRNMLAGVGAIDACLLVVDAREGWMPQTEEHFEILRLLGVPTGIIAITKCDLVDPAEVDSLATLIRHRCEGSFLADAPVARTSITDAGSIAGLWDLLTAIPQRTNQGGIRPRLWIDRVFAASGVGTVVTGTLLDAPLRRGDEVLIVPGERKARIRGLQSRGVDTEIGVVGSRLAVNLSGVAHTEMERGHQLVLPDQWWFADTFDAEVRALPNLRHSVNRRGNFLLYIGTEELPATIRLIGKDEIAPGGSANARVYLPRRIAVAPRDRFIIRETGRDETVAGGIVLEVDPTSRLSKARPTDDVSEQVAQRGVVGTKELFLRTGQVHEPTVDDVLFSSAMLSASMDELIGLVNGSGDAGVEIASLNDSLQHVARLVRPERARIENGRLYAPDRLPSLRVNDPILDRFSARPFSPPDADEFDRDTLRRLVQVGQLVKLDGIHFATLAIDAAHDVARRLLADNPTGYTASQFRDALATTRKFAIPLAEALDARGITRRRGDVRIAGPRL